LRTNDLFTAMPGLIAGDSPFDGGRTNPDDGGAGLRTFGGACRPPEVLPLGARPVRMRLKPGATNGPTRR
jgi:hypothetical protein